MNPSELERLPLRMEQLYREIGELMMEDVVRRIKKTGKITSTADYQIQRLTLLGATSEEIEREIKKRLNLSYAELWRLYDEVVDWEYVRNKDIYEQINGNFIPWEDNYQLQQITRGIMDNALEDLKNITRSMGFAIQTADGLKFTPMADYYQKYLDQAMLGIVTGAFDYNTVLRKCITQMTNSGIRVVDYASGHSNRIDVAARRAVMTGLSQVTGKITDYHAGRLGIDTYEVAWHAGARNTGSGYLNHQSWQGRVYTRQQLIDICGLGMGGGLCGWNCYHEYYMFFPGLSKRNWSDDWLESMNMAENIPKEYNGKWYDMYQATQKQRSMETAMRAQREKVRLLQAGEADKDTILNERIKYNGQLYEYAKFSNQMGLKQQRERIYLDMKGTVGIKGKAPMLKKSSLSKAERYSKFSERFQDYNNGQNDAITYKRLLNNLNKSDIGKEIVAYIIDHPELNIQMCYNIDHPKDTDGQQFGNTIQIYASDTKTVQRTAEVLIHEITHHRYDIGGNQWSECVCKAQEVKHRNKRNELTSDELRSIIKAVKQLYPELPWRR
ncbi:MAG: phage minor capsid protein [Coprococcus catus]|nr:phage minor capsid protein [Coprococcus catus]